MIKSSTSNIVRKNSFLIFWFLEGTVRPYDMVIVEARYSCRLLITTSFSMNFYDLISNSYDTYCTSLNASVKNFGDFSNLQASSPKMSQNKVN